MRKVAVDELVADLSPLGSADHETAATKAGQMVRDIGAGEAEALRERGRVGRTVQQGQQNARPRRVRERLAQAVQRGSAGLEPQHGLDDTASTELSANA